MASITIKETITRSIAEALEKMGLFYSPIVLEHPENPLHGDYSSNIALVLGKKENADPQSLAEKIIEHIKKPKEIFKVEVARPGFINFFLSGAFFSKALAGILKEKDNYGKNNILKNKKIIIEYTDPNPFKEFHIGHLMSNAIGESLSRIIEFSGAEVKRANYQGDVGLHVAKAIWGKIQKTDLSWGAAYAHGANNYEVNKKEVDEINKKIYEKNDGAINEIYELGRAWSLEQFEKIYKRMGTRFDFYFFESETGGVGKQIVEENIENGIFEKSDGAVVFHGEKFDNKLHTRVFITKDKLPAYEAKEIGLIKIKNERYPHDSSFVVTGNEVKEYFLVVHKAIEQIFPELAKKMKHIPHGMLRLSSGKMSSRTGDVVFAEFLLDNVKNKVLEKMKDSKIPNKETVADKVSVGAVKYSILKQSAGNDIVFDPEKSLSFEGDSGPYLQYTHARTCSVIEKAKEENIKVSVKKIPEQVEDIERLLERFPEITKRACKELEPHHVATYLTQLAGAFNAFYAKNRIVEAGENAPYRLALAKAVSIVLKNGLWLLGIEAPERM